MHTMPDKNGPFLNQHFSGIIFYRINIIGSEDAIANAEKHDPTLRNFYYKSVPVVPYRTVRTVPYYSTTYDAGPYERTRQHCLAL